VAVTAGAGRTIIGIIVTGRDPDGEARTESVREARSFRRRRASGCL
jgi:hypothetical protein